MISVLDGVDAGDVPSHAKISGVTITFGPPANIRYGLTVLIHNSGHFGPPLAFCAPGPPGIAGAADG